ncbi:MAG: hypothetical protein Q9190_007242 [Brigantiaea leucoxantha]
MEQSATSHSFRGLARKVALATKMPTAVDSVAIERRIVTPLPSRTTSLGFFDLPAEVRNNIYWLLLEPVRFPDPPRGPIPGITIYVKEWPNLPGTKKGSPSNLCFFLTSQQIYFEASSLFYSQHIFYAQTIDDLNSFLHAISSHSRQSLTRLAVHRLEDDRIPRAIRLWGRITHVVSHIDVFFGIGMPTDAFEFRWLSALLAKADPEIVTFSVAKNPRDRVPWYEVGQRRLVPAHISLFASFQSFASYDEIVSQKVVYQKADRQRVVGRDESDDENMYHKALLDML